MSAHERRKTRREKEIFAAGRVAVEVKLSAEARCENLSASLVQANEQIDSLRGRVKHDAGMIRVISAELEEREGWAHQLDLRSVRILELERDLSATNHTVTGLCEEVERLRKLDTDAKKLRRRLHQASERERDLKSLLSKAKQKAIEAWAEK